MNIVSASVLVTGGAGFIGSHLTEKLLEMGANVTVYDKFDRYYEGKEENLALAANSRNFVLVNGDILDRDKLATVMKGTDIVFHEAGQPGVGFSVDNPNITNEVNVVGTLNVLWSARTNGAMRVVNASSSSIFGKPQYLPLNEEHPKSPTSPYGVSKLAAEQYGIAFHRVYGLDVVSLRYFSVYGPRGRPDQVVHRFTQSLAKGEPPVINGDGTHTRDFTNVDDVVSATILAAEVEGIGGETFNIGFGARTSINELARRLIIMSGMEGKVVARHQGGSKGDFPDTQADNRKAVRVLGWRPKIDLEEGLRGYVDWFESNVEVAKTAS
ncbi:MAG: GDP-mannose 4,6-dehydratase [Thaumarchaeota archaeon]|nr:GDP-mannose 4,6-dehydratase [Nitrososphaerota archaeon]